MTQTDSLLLLPHEQLTLANTHEAAELRRYRRLALSFLPKAPQTSRLMATLGLQCEKRLDTLRQAARSLELDACVMALPAGVPRCALNDRHFFIVDDATGNQVVEQAIRAAVESKNFFEWLVDTNATAELHQPFLSFAREKEGECRVLLEFWEQHHQSPVRLRQA
ncbi:hypothetical protein HOP62_04720 [Halomonas sp. MCCC 1A17488]|uniref:Uncharacterized protein n=1 Tax=Billgrantia sulfidoxydans TaxID=2733484 RepID=A0ABX7W3Z2_9GAMM|nr:MULTISPECIES: hypothetical protein [Halomonas]MCE8015377.1 hypothetical protein [Halomonas sp. MCCC 1A17488]MCG3238710.1 hypothetical protein [Halomonas sp. MCCC 1A17488]QPP51319.1 hypothetical protein I4484_09680 [Halomonas sp. SS10-MC5]QTP54875.1 hypothetical protein HNO51_09390 [Halomonas sulfidoxydans]